MLIGEVSRRSGISVRMLRHYDSQGLVSPSRRTGGGYRDYSRGDLGRLLKVESLRSLGMGIAEVRTALDDPGLDVAAVIDRLREETRQRIREEQALLTHLDSLGGHAGRDGGGAPESWDDVLAVTSLLNALRSGHPTERQSAALRSTPGQATTALVSSYLDEPDPNVAGTLRWSLARAGEDAVPALVARIPSADAPTRLRIVEALDAVPTVPTVSTVPDVLAVLTDLADDPDPTVRSRAVLSLARRSGPAPTGGLVDRLVTLVTDGDHDVEAAEALTALCRRHPASGETVVASLVAAGGPASPASPGARLRTVQALAELSGTVDAAVPALADFATDPDRTVARTARALSGRSPGGRTCRGR